MKFFTTSKISENIHETPEGYLVCIGVPIARTGEMIYGAGETPLEAGPDGRVFVDRSAEEVFKPETLASFEGKAITIMHPDEFVSPENWSNLAKGILQNLRRGKGEQENDLVADLLITEVRAIELVKQGLREVSCGYEAEYTQTGIGRGFQSNIVGNHLALVDEGRAGSSYAINDHKGKGLKMTLAERIKGIFAKAQDEALKAAEVKDGNMETPEEKKGFVSVDEMKSYMDAKFDELMGKKEEKKADDASTQPTASEPAHIEAKDEEKEKADKQAARDAFIDAMMEKSKEESKDADNEEEEKSEDESSCDDMEEAEGTMVGDSASRVEILAPGMVAKGKDFRAKALIAAYATKDGKAAIDKFTNGTLPDMKNGAQVEAIFIGASEILKATRSSELSKTKTRDFNPSADSLTSGVMTAEKMNELNAKYYAAKK